MYRKSGEEHSCAEYISPAQVEKIFGIKQATIRAWVRQGRIKGYKIDKLVLLKTSDLRERFERLERGEDFLDEHNYISNISVNLVSTPSRGVRE